MTSTDTGRQDTGTVEWAGGNSMYRPCSVRGARHWGPDGAAGLLAWTKGRDGRRYVLLAKRSRYVQQGSTWAFPGGAVDQGESPVEAAVRELDEEVAGAPDLMNLTAVREGPCPHGCGWAYTAFVAYAENAADPAHGRLPNVPRVAVAAGESAWETDVVAWIPLDYVQELPLHPAVAASWPALREIIEQAG
jgi:ADP-ribose pyrophosphatase YjhB (NUDIX family)